MEYVTDDEEALLADPVDAAARNTSEVEEAGRQLENSAPAGGLFLWYRQQLIMNAQALGIHAVAINNYYTVWLHTG